MVDLDRDVKLATDRISANLIRSFGWLARASSVRSPFFLTGAWRGKSIDDQSTRTHACTYSTAAVDNSSGQMKEKRKRLCVWYARKLKFPRRVFKYRKLLLGTVSEFDSKKRLGRVTNSFPYRLGACLIFTRLPTKSVNNTLTKKKLAGWLAWRTGKAQK